MNIDNDTTTVSFAQQRLHVVYATCQSYSPFNSREHIRDHANVDWRSTISSLPSAAIASIAAVASDVDCRSSGPKTPPRPNTSGGDDNSQTTNACTNHHRLSTGTSVASDGDYRSSGPNIPPGPDTSGGDNNSQTTKKGTIQSFKQDNLPDKKPRHKN
nr:hypothetical protein [Tanacetum cinerariifolium]